MWTLMIVTMLSGPHEIGTYAAKEQCAKVAEDLMWLPVLGPLEGVLCVPPTPDTEDEDDEERTPA